jgi:hypothetical protein
MTGEILPLETTFITVWHYTQLCRDVLGHHQVWLQENNKIKHLYPLCMETEICLLQLIVI